jgi:hypothetical protein
MKFILFSVHSVRSTRCLGITFFLLISSCENLNPLHVIRSAKKAVHTYMHDRGPPMDVILQTKLAAVRYRIFRSRISIYYALDIRPRNALGKWGQPALGFPFPKSIGLDSN